MSNATTKLRSLFLATLMVVSVFAGTLAFAGAASAELNGDTVTATDVSADAQYTQQRIHVTNANVTNDTITISASNLPANADIAAADASFNVNNVDVSADGTTVTMSGIGSVSGDAYITLTWDTVNVESGTSGNLSVAGTDVNVNFIDADPAAGFVNGGQTFWKGQGLYFQAGDLSSNTFQIREVEDNDGSDEIGSLVTEFSVGDNGVQILSTDSDNIEAGQEYIITNGDGQVVNTNELGIAQAPVNATDQNINDNSWEVQTQSLSAQWDDSEVSTEADDTTTTLEVDSNRAGFPLQVSANNLDAAELEEIFEVEGQNVVPTEDQDGNDVVVITDVSSNADLTANFGPADANDYNFQIEAADTGVPAQANISVTEDEGQVNIPGTVVEERGDTATITASFTNTDTGYIQIGSDEVGYNVTVAVEDGGDGQIALEMNTFEAGLAGPSWDNANAGANLTNEEAVYSLSDDSEDDDDEIVNVWAHSDGLANPLEAGTYDIGVATDAQNAQNGQWVDDEDDLGSLDLQERSTQGVQIWRASGQANYDNLDELLTMVNQTNRVAGGLDQPVGDLLVVQLQASGIYGQVQDEDPSSIYQPDDGLWLTIETEEAANQDEVQLNLTNSNAVEELYTDEENNTAYLVVDPTQSASGDFQFDADEEYTAHWEINEENAMVEADEDTAGQEEEVAEETFDLVEPEAQFTNLQGDVLQVPVGNSVSVEGNSNLAGGTELTVRLRSDEGASFLTSNTVTVDSNGTFSATFDTSDREVNTTFTAVVRQSGNDLSDEVDGVFVQQTQTPEPETPGETTTPGETPGETATPGETTSPGETAAPGGTTTTTTTGGGDTTTTAGTTSEQTPGFGVVVALVALVAAALLAVRRDN